MKDKWGLKSAKHHPALRVKKQNNVASKQMDNYIHVMQQKCHEQTEKLEKSMKNLRRQLEEKEKARSCSNSRISACRATSGSMMRRYTMTPESSLSRRNQRKVPTWHENAEKSSNSCRLFPCRPPSTYHTIGFRLDPSNTKWLPWSQVRRSLSSETLAAFAASTILNTGRSRLSIDKRIEMLQQEMENRRRRRIQERPPSWEVNYGKPMPYKILNFPVKLDPIE